MIIDETDYIRYHRGFGLASWKAQIPINGGNKTKGSEEERSDAFMRDKHKHNPVKTHYSRRSSSNIQ